MPVTIVWFKRDLRTEDHAPLRAAAERGRIVPLYVAEPEFWAQPTMSARHWAFVSDSLRALAQDLAARGAPLVLRFGDAVQALRAVAELAGADAIFAHQETGDLWSYARDRRVAAWARGAGVALREWQAGGVIRRSPTRDAWAARWEATMRQPAVAAPQTIAGVAGLDGLRDAAAIPGPQALGLMPDPCQQRQPGGRRAALEALESFLHERGRDYRRAMASPVTGFDACSRLSAHLASGTLSSREAAQAGWARQAQIRAEGAAPGWAGSVDSFLSRLHWRCHFMQKLEDEPEIERRCMHRAYEGLREAEHDPARLAAWEAGETGFPFVDACMRALRATGWMNFRMRSLLTAFGAYHLWLDWRRLAPPLARMFTDYEPGIHYSQLQMQSGVTGINTTRIYNPVKQSMDQDPQGAFIRAWVPELSGVPLARLHEPWKMSGAEQAQAGCVIGRDYPAPIVDHAKAARAARERVWAVRKGDTFRAEKTEVMRRHASRRRDREGPARKPRPDARQSAFDF